MGETELSCSAHTGECGLGSDRQTNNLTKEMKEGKEEENLMTFSLIKGILFPRPFYHKTVSLAAGTCLASHQVTLYIHEFTNSKNAVSIHMQTRLVLHKSQQWKCIHCMED